MLEYLWISFQVVFPILFFMAVGWLIQKTGLLKAQDFSQLNRLVFRVFLPIKLFSEVYLSDFETAFQPDVVLYGMVGVLICFLATWFLSDETVREIVEGNAVIDSGSTTDTTLIKLPEENPGTDPENPGQTTDLNSIELIDIEGKTYKGKLLIVQNPKRVYIGTPAAYGTDHEGVSTIDMVRNANALYGVNGGGFYDTGKGNGGVPTGRENSDGIVISKGALLWGSRNQEYEIIGINRQGILVLGKMTGQEALDSGIVEALNFGPYLVVNGEACEVGGFTEAGLNPRTAIGQRADGAFLILTIDGRQPSSMGATYEDLIEIMMNYGAVNAANLDGGSSTYMVQNSETENNPQIITQCASLYGPRKMATSILVGRVDQINTQYE